MNNDGKKLSIDEEFIRLVKQRKFIEAEPLISKVNDINVRDPKTQATAAHFAFGCGMGNGTQ